MNLIVNNLCGAMKCIMRGIIALLKALNIFSLPPRINRRRHFAVNLFYLFIFLCIFCIIDYFRLSKPIEKILQYVLAYSYLISVFVLKTKRLHDINLSGGWILVLFIPIIGAIFGILLFFIRGTKGKNRFGLPCD